MGRGLAVGEGLAVGVGVGVAVGVGVGVGVGVNVAVAVAVGVGVGVGLGAAAAQYRPPVFEEVPSNPPQTIIWLPVQTALCCIRAVGALVVLVAVQQSVP